MSLQICIKCHEFAMTWKMDGQERTWWFCSECDLLIQEDESRECRCRICKYPLPTVSWLFEADNGFYWCFNCNRTTEKITFDPPTDEDWERVEQTLNA